MSQWQIKGCLIEYMNKLAYIDNLSEDLNDRLLREMVFKRLMKEYGRVIERELRKNPITLADSASRLALLVRKEFLMAYPCNST